jgi:hypothetical protein
MQRKPWYQIVAPASAVAAGGEILNNPVRWTCAEVYFCRNTHSTNNFKSPSDNAVFGGIGAAPHTPLPPCLIFAASLPAAPASAPYFAATSLNDGPTTRWSS